MDKPALFLTIPESRANLSAWKGCVRQQEYLRYWCFQR
jgi:hypothetical protein